ncbi:MAG: hypothetical protein Q9162_003615 [Coniocarpon cinnabarinum]
MSTPTLQWQLTNRPKDTPTTTGDSPTWQLKRVALPVLKSNQLLVKTLYLSNDPAQRGWMSARAAADPSRFYATPVQIGEPMRARGICEVTESTDPKFKNGDLVLGQCGWSEQAVLNAAEAIPVSPLPGGLSNTHYLGALGSTGLTAYYGLVETARTKPIDVVVVSGAAGATGSMVVQIARKVIGCRRVIGIAGGEEKCKWVESLGADVCVDYKNPRGGDLNDALKQALGEGQYADVYFDNVGGYILDTMLLLMSNYGRVAACGAVSNYNNESNAYALKNTFRIVVNRIEIKGFIVFDFLHKRAEILDLYRRAIADGRISLDDKNETIVETKFEDVPATWMRLFEGRNQGKLVTKIVQ